MLQGQHPQGIYYLKVVNTSANSQYFHIYYGGGNTHVSFANPDPGYTIDTPAEADTAISVGAYVTRTSWTNYQGNKYSTGEILNSIASFSSHGPRVDPQSPGKPNIVAPGSAVISARDQLYTLGGPNSSYIIKTSGPNNGSPPADYFVMEGTSMATPHAAGVGALILAMHPGFAPLQIRQALQNTAIDEGTPGFDNTSGWGLVNATAAVAWHTPPADFNGDGSTDISIFRPSIGAWAINNVGVYYWGASGDIPVPADYNGDGKTEIAIFRPSVGAWAIKDVGVYYWGASGDVPVPADYNGDGTTDIAIFRPSIGGWAVQGGSVNYYGASGDVPAPVMTSVRYMKFGN